jgi:phenylalanyl-tRNA synthetase beta subunit
LKACSWVEWSQVDLGYAFIYYCLLKHSLFYLHILDIDILAAIVVVVSLSFQLIRSVAGDLVERVDLFDEFTNTKTGKQSHAYRITYRHMDRSLTNAEVDDLQLVVRNQLVEKLGVALR